MGAVLAARAVWPIAGERGPLPRARRHLEHHVLTEREGETHEYAVPATRAALFSLGVGFLSSFLGIGGRVIKWLLAVGLLALAARLLAGA